MLNLCDYTRQLLHFCDYTRMVSEKIIIKVWGPVPIWWCPYTYGDFARIGTNIYLNEFDWNPEEYKQNIIKKQCFDMALIEPILWVDNILQGFSKTNHWEYISSLNWFILLHRFQKLIHWT